MTTNDPNKNTASTYLSSGIHPNNYITFHGNPSTITTGHTFTTTAAHINAYGTPHIRPCSVCTTNVAMLPQTECMFLAGFWFCNNDCRLEFIFRQLVRTDHVDR